ncbi:MAG: hypothetical protein IT379_04655 [Deltaproteobacteria bacterium]|nr:hypothetical protein [Deltaproteobacteria bacterium]
MRSCSLRRSSFTPFARRSGVLRLRRRPRSRAHSELARTGAVGSVALALFACGGDVRIAREDATHVAPAAPTHIDSWPEPSRRLSPASVPAEARRLDIAPIARTGPPPPTYHQDVAPIFATRCVTCHDEGGIAPFSLRAYDAAAAQAESIAWVVEHHIMPPWPAAPTDGCEPLRDSRRLTDAEVALVVGWAAAGAPEGDADTAAPIVPGTEPRFTRSAEAVSAEPYEVAPGADQLRCFVVDPGLDQDRFLTAFRVRVDRSEVVHHLMLQAIDDAGQEELILARDRDDPAPGYACDEGGLGGSTRGLVVWAQGDRTRRWPEPTGLRVTAHRKLVLQIHYHPIDVSVLDRTAVELELEARVAREGEMRSLSVAGSPLPPRERDVEVVASGRPTREGPIVVHGVRAHMHQLGARARIEVVRDGTPRCLLDIPDWQFEWQLFYDLARPFVMEETDELRVTCAYDTTSRIEPVGWGTSSDEEMCIGYVYVTVP